MVLCVSSALTPVPAPTAALLMAATEASSSDISTQQVAQLAAMSAALTVQKAASEKLASAEGAERVGLLKGGFVKGQWTKEEDELVCKYVELYGTKQWARIALVLPGRKGKQCRERWHNHLNPDINKDAWNHEEDLKLVEAHLVSLPIALPCLAVLPIQRFCSQPTAKQPLFSLPPAHTSCACPAKGESVGRNCEGVTWTNG